MTDGPPHFPEDAPEVGASVHVRYHTAGGVDKASVGEVTDVETQPGGYTATVREDFAASLRVDVSSLAVMTSWPPDESPEWKRAGVLKVLRERPSGELPEVDRQVKRFYSRSSLACPACGGGGAVVEGGEPHCSDCGERLDIG